MSVEEINAVVSRFGSSVGLNSSQKKWLVTIRDYLQKDGQQAEPVGWIMTEDAAIEFLNRISNDLEKHMKTNYEGCIVTRENHIEQNNHAPSVKLYVEEAGKLYGHYGRKQAYLVEVIVLPKLVDAPEIEEKNTNPESPKKK